MKEAIPLKEQLAEHIKRNFIKGYTEDSLRYSLLSQGYGRTTIENAINLANKKLAEEAPKMKEMPRITHKIIDEEELKKKVEEDAKKGFFKKFLKFLSG